MEKKENAVDAALQMPKASALEQALEQRIRQESGAVVAFVDLDGFGAVNARFGSKEGDRVLIDAGRYVRDSVGGAGACYRYGGDEFAVLFSEEIEREHAFLLLEKLRMGYADPMQEKTPLTLSIGIASYGDDAVTVAELTRKAEGAMFRAKQQGKNRVCLARDEKMVTKTAHYTADQLLRLTKLSKREGVGEAILLREALDMLLKKYDV